MIFAALSKEARMQVENITRVSFTSRRTTEKKRNFPVCNCLF